MIKAHVTGIIFSSILTYLVLQSTSNLSTSVYGVDITNNELQYTPYEDKKGTIDVVFCSQNEYFRSDTFTLGYSCYKAIDERTKGFGTRLDLPRKADYAIYELPAVSKIHKIELIFLNGNKRQYDITIQVADAGSHVQGDEKSVKWTTIFKGKTANVAGNKDNPDPVTLMFNDVEGQFIRIIGRGAFADGKLNTLITQHTSISDIQIFGEKTNEVYSYNNEGTAKANK